MKITIEQLKILKACRPQLDLFIELGLDGVEITEELCVKHAQDFDWDWAALNLLKPDAFGEYERLKWPTWAEYIRATSQTWLEYVRVRNAAFMEYVRVTPPDRAESYVGDSALALAEYDLSDIPARVEYNTGCARAFHTATLTISVY